MRKLYETVHAIFARGSRSTEDVITECRRSGLSLKAETVELFLHLSRELQLRDGLWELRAGSTADEIARSLEKVFSTGQAYVPVDQLSKHLGDNPSVTSDDIDKVCESTGQYEVKGKFIVRRKTSI